MKRSRSTKKKRINSSKYSPFDFTYRKENMYTQT